MDYDFTTSFLGAPQWGPQLKPRKPVPDPQDVFCNPQKLDVALKLDISDHYRRYLVNRKTAIDNNEEFIFDAKYELFLVTPGLYTVDLMKTSTEFLPLLMNKILTGDKKNSTRNDISDMIRRSLDLTYRNVRLQFNYNMDVMTSSCKEQVEQNKDAYLSRVKNAAPEITNLIEAYYLMSEIVDKIPGGQIPKGMKKRDTIVDRMNAIIMWDMNRAEMDTYGMKFFWSGDICVIQADREQYLLPIVAIVELQNKIADHLSVLLYAWNAQGTYIEKSAYKETVSFLKDLHSRHINYPKSFFAVAGALEALGTAILISRHDDWKNGPNTEFLTSTLNDLSASCSKEGEPGLSLSSPLVKRLTKLTSPLVSELCCLSKMSGHPITSISKGMEKLHERTTRARTINLNAVAYTTQSVKHEFLKEYFATNGCHPPNISLDPSCIQRFCSAFTIGVDIDDPSLDCYGPYRLEDLALVHITDFESLDYLDNILPYLKDTASSVLQSKVWKHYINDRGHPERKDIKYQKILLMYVLGSPEEIDHITFAHEFEKYGAAIEDFMENFAIRLVAKEKELKPVARLFGCMTYKFRAVNQIVLRFMQKYLRKYCSSQAMVITELELARKLTAFSKKKNLGEGMRSFTLCMDAEGWNNAFTKETVDAPLRETVDAMLGNSMVSKIHEAFEHTVFYAQEKGNVVYYAGQNGGIEGLQQGSWMLVYVHQIKYALRDCPYDYHILIKGDDVRVRFEISKSRAVPGSEPELLENIRSNIISSLAEFGHKIKPLDSYYSENVLVFSKKTFVEEVAMPTSFRQIQKTYGANNKFMATTDDLVGSAYSNAHSAAGYGVNILAPYIVALFWSSIHIMRIKWYRRMPDNELLALMLTPSAFGGFPVIYLHNMFVRAESDLVTAFCGLAIYCRTADRSLYTQFKKVINYELALRKPWGLLIADPYALPRKGYANPTAIIEKALKNKLRARAVNPAVKQLFSKDVDRFKEEFIKAVTSADRFDAKLVNSVAECTDFAVQERFLQKFLSAKTMIQHIWSMTERLAEIRNLCTRLLKESDQRDYQRSQLFSSKPARRVGVHLDQYDCPTLLSENCRTIGWGKPIDGITYPNAQHQVRVMSADEVKLKDVTKMFVYEIKPGSEISPYMPTPHFHRSLLDPYLGHYTPSGTIGAPLEIDTQDIVVGIVRKLLTLSTMVLLESTDDQPKGSFTMYDLVLYLLSRFTSLSINSLEIMINKRKSGTRTHHLPARGFRVGIIPNMSKNLMSHIQSQVNTYRALRVTGENFRINFLHLFCHTSVILHFNWFLPNTEMNVGSYRAWIPECKECFIPIEEKNMYMFDDSILNSETTIPDNLSALVEHSNELIKIAMESEAMESDVRQVGEAEEPAAEVACMVVGNEFFSSTILHHARMTLGYRIIHPTAERVKDVIMMKGRAKKNRDITGSELVKIPSAMLVETIRDTVIHHVYVIKKAWKKEDIIASFIIEDGRSLPWSTCIQQLMRNSKIQSVIAEVCEFVSLPLSAGANAAREYGKASTFIGRALSTLALERLPESNSSIRVGKYTKTSDIHLQINNKRVSRLLHLVTTYKFVDLQEDIYEFGIWGDSFSIIVSILLLATGPTWSVEKLRNLFSVTEAVRKISIIDEVGPSWYGGVEEQRFWSRVGRDHIALLELWLDGSDYSLYDLEEYLCNPDMGMREDYLKATSWNTNLMTDITVYFLDLSECYQIVRSMEVPQELDDYGSANAAILDVAELSSCQLIQRSEALIEKKWDLPTTALDWGPATADSAPLPRRVDKIDFTHLTRPLGWTTSAWMKTARILEALGVYNKWKKKHIYIGCFADGDGGDSRWFAESFPYSQVIWNSINPDLADHMQNPIASRVRSKEAKIISTHPRIHSDIQMMEGGDLTKDYVVKLLCDQAPNYAIIKHDADLPFTEEREAVARKIWSNVLRIWVRHGLPRSVLIEKVFCDIPDTLSWFLTWARLHSKLCYLITLPESHCSYECYVVCIDPQGVLPSVLPVLRAPAAIAQVVYECQDHCSATITSCSSGVSEREENIPFPLKVFAGEAPPPKCIGALQAFGVTVDDLVDPIIVVGKLDSVIGSLKRQLDYGDVELDYLPVISESITRALGIVEQMVFTWSILAIIQTLGCESEQVKERLTRETKNEIWKDVNDKIKMVTISRRFVGVGGPFNIMSKETVYKPLAGEELVTGNKLKFRENFFSGLKTGMEYVAYVCYVRG